MAELMNSKFSSFNEFFDSEYYKSSFNDDEFKKHNYEDCLGNSGNKFFYEWPQFDIAIIGTPRSYYEEVMFNPDINEKRETEFKRMAENGDERQKKFGLCLCIIADIHTQGDTYQGIYRSISKIIQKNV